MKIAVINGSPTGCRGTTAQYIKYLEQAFPQHQFVVLEVARRIKQLERDQKHLAKTKQVIQEADAILWCFPVYFMLVPAQLKRFIELLFEDQSITSNLADKVSSVISTSAHFYDHTAHDYMRGICSDLGLS